MKPESLGLPPLEVKSGFADLAHHGDVPPWFVAFAEKFDHKFNLLDLRLRALEGRGSRPGSPSLLRQAPFPGVSQSVVSKSKKHCFLSK
jgi:hypothetical protein